MLSELARRHQVVLVTTHGPEDDPEGLAKALQHCERVVSLPYAVPKRGTIRFLFALLRSWLSPYPVDLWKWRAADVRRRVDHFLKTSHFDLVIVDFLVAFWNVTPMSGVPRVFFAHNVEYVIWKRLRDVEHRWWLRQLLTLEFVKMRKSEARACAETCLTVAVSTADRDRLAALSPTARVVAVPTGVDTDYFKPQRNETPGRLVFSGSMDWYPNEDAVLYFVDEILPRVRSHIPDVSLAVVGRNPSVKIRALGNRAGVHVTGTVDDVRPHVGEAELYVVPLRVGGGTRLKIFEALAMGKATLSTTIGAEGLDVVPGTHLQLADGPAMFSEAIVALLRDPERRRSLGREGRRLVEERYSWASVTRTFEERLQEIRRN
jgi:glycosyltransferase involved in cell wall biosynthesis